MVLLNGNVVKILHVNVEERFRDPETMLIKNTENVTIVWAIKRQPITSATFGIVPFIKK
jgi:hypothetical protein